jgi:hypothetical protein
VLRRVRFHIGAQDGVDAGLVSALLPEPGEQVRIQTHGDNRFSRGPYHLRVFPELFIRGPHVGIGRNAAAYLDTTPFTQCVPVCTRALLNFRCFASRSFVRAAPTAMPR